MKISLIKNLGETNRKRLETLRRFFVFSTTLLFWYIIFYIFYTLFRIQTDGILSPRVIELAGVICWLTLAPLSIYLSAKTAGIKIKPPQTGSKPKE